MPNGLYKTELSKCDMSTGINNFYNLKIFAIFKTKPFIFSNITKSFHL